MKKPRYIIIDQNRGVFLGTYADEDVAEDPSAETSDKRYALFASNNPFCITKACSFNSENMAQAYIKDVFAPRRWEELDAMPIESDEEYPDVIEIIKSGYGDHIYDMLDGLFDDMEDATIH
jgi:hypothetical protein